MYRAPSKGARRVRLHIRSGRRLNRNGCCPVFRSICGQAPLWACIQLGRWRCPKRRKGQPMEPRYHSDRSCVAGGRPAACTTSQAGYVVIREALLHPYERLADRPGIRVDYEFR